MMFSQKINIKEIKISKNSMDMVKVQNRCKKIFQIKGLKMRIIINIKDGFKMKTFDKIIIDNNHMKIDTKTSTKVREEAIILMHKDSHRNLPEMVK